MKLPQPFHRLPLRVDVARLQREVAHFVERDWQHHPTGFAGNSAIRLISVGGGDNDDFAGAMAPTPQLAHCPYIRQILAAFGVAWSRSRLMRLAPGAAVPEHCDVNHHWFNRVRIHIPVQTGREVLFNCGGETVHMAAGEAWLFDNWRLHSVFNGSAQDRIHLVADTVGNAAFWQLLGASQTADFEQPPQTPPMPIAFQPDADARPLCEAQGVGRIMHPAEVELLTGDLLSDLQNRPDAEGQRALNAFVAVALTFSREWRMLWALFGDAPAGWPHFGKLRAWAIDQNQQQSRAVVCASNGMAAVDVFLPRVLIYACGAGDGTVGRDVDRTVSAAAPASAVNARASVRAPRIHQPIFIVAAPRSGSTLLFETLAQARALWTVGGEAHWLVESLPQLLPWAEGVGSNRLNAAHVDEAVRQHIVESLTAQLRDREQRAAAESAQGMVRVLEKTPKHALRIPFFDEIFPDARFIFLWRDPRENLSSMIEAWRSGGWVTYPQLPGWDGPWSLLLPPGWQALRGKTLADVVAFQWRRSNEIILDDLISLPDERWTTLSYADFIADPRSCVRRLCNFADIGFDDALAAHLAAPLPLSAYTQTVPAPDKWRRNAAEVLRVLPQTEAMHQRLLQISRSKSG